MKIFFLKIIRRADVGYTAAQLGLLSVQLFHVLTKISRKPVLANNATLSDAGVLGDTFLCSKLHNQDMQCTKEFDQISIGAPGI